MFSFGIAVIQSQNNKYTDFPLFFCNSPAEHLTSIYTFTPFGWAQALIATIGSSITQNFDDLSTIWHLE